MAPMMAQRIVGSLERPTYAYGRGLLANAEMDGAAHLLLRVTRRDLLLDPANPEHLGEEGESRARMHGRILREIHYRVARKVIPSAEPMYV
jgi:hypothetical protein